jgi:tetratricopeptide (TPR) repeat protein
LILALLAVAGGILVAEDDFFARTKAAWMSNDYDTIETALKAELKTDAENGEAWLQMAILHEFRNQKADAIDCYMKALEYLPDAELYMPGIMTTRLFRSAYVADSKWYNLLYNYQPAGQDAAWQQYIKDNLFAETAKKSFKLGKAAKLFSKLNVVRTWSLIGCFPNISGSGMDVVYPPETEFNPAAEYTGRANSPAFWFDATEPKVRTSIAVSDYFSYRDAVYYANTFVNSPETMLVQIRLSGYGAFKVFLNDQEIFFEAHEANQGYDKFIIETRLQAGWNRLLIKNGISEKDDAFFTCRLTDVEGNALDGLEINTQVQQYASRQDAPVSLKEHPALAYFRNRVAQHPDDLGSLWMLYKVYGFAGYEEQAEELIYPWLTSCPDCELVMIIMDDLYDYNGKEDEQKNLNEQLYKINKTNYNVLTWKILDYVSNKDFEKAEQDLELLSTLYSGSEMEYLCRVHLYAAKQDQQQLYEAIEEGFETYPNNRLLTMYIAMVYSDGAKQHSTAAMKVKEHLKKNFSLTMYEMYIKYLLEAGELAKWETNFLKAYKYYPENSRLRNAKANVHKERKEFEMAAQEVADAITIAPNRPHYWQLKGDIDREQGNQQEAIMAYQRSIQMNPNNYEAREILREMQGEEHVFSLMPQYDVEALIADAPGKEAYPEDSDVMLLDMHHEVHYPGGGSQSMVELVAKVFDQDAVETWTEFYLPYNPYHYKGSIEIAEVVKADGAIIKADTDGRQVVFKNLEPNDVVHLKWKINRYQYGPFVDRVYQQWNMNSGSPVLHSDFTVMVPTGYELNYQNRGTDTQPQIEEKGEFTCYSWITQDLPSIKPETSMPPYGDITERIYVSSIAGWQDIAAWYQQVTHNKTEVNYEVKEVVDELLATSDSLSAGDKVKLVYDYITENITYSNVSFRQSSYIPQTARDVLKTRIGDCKDVSTLCIAMLREMGVDAWYTLINTRSAGQQKAALPTMDVFNHCVVMADIDGALQLVDCTYRDFAFGGMSPANEDAIYLLIRDDVENSAYTSAEGYPQDADTCTMDITLNADGSINAHQTITSTYFGGGVLRMMYRHEADSDRVRMMQEMLSEKFPGLVISHLQMQGMDELVPVTSIEYDFTAPNYLITMGSFKMVKLPWFTDNTDPETISYAERKHPIFQWDHIDVSEETITLNLPANLTVVELPKDVELHTQWGDYVMRFKKKDAVVTVTRSLHIKTFDVPVEEYASFKEFLSEILKNDKQQLLLKDA